MIFLEIPINSDPSKSDPAKTVMDEYQVQLTRVRFKDRSFEHDQYSLSDGEEQDELTDITYECLQPLQDTQISEAEYNDAVNEVISRIQELFICEFHWKPFADQYIFDNDVVLTNYDLLNKDSAFFRSIHWHRIVLDECQEIKISTGKIAQECARLYSNHRWMVSGTPLVGRIEDLHGELNFLRVWPFSLSDKEDGFWSVKIGAPFREKQPASLRLLDCLIGATMMRHSTSTPGSG